MDKYHTTEVSSLSDFITQLETRIDDQYKIILFRGQSTDKALVPKIARYLYKKSREVDEKRMFREFNINAIQYLNSEPKTDLERLTIAQHHGLPTRLLDWTENALAALYFAVSKTPKQGDNSVVWVMSINRNCKLLIDEHEENLKIFEQKKHRIYKPATIIPRISSQHGWFSLHPFKGQGYYSRVEEINDENIKLSKIIIKNGTEVKIRQTLEVCGINRHTIFRDLDSLGDYVFQKFKK